MNRTEFYKVFYPIFNTALEAYTLVNLLKETPVILHISGDSKSQDILQNCIKFFNTDINVIKIPAWDCLPYDRVSPSLHISGERTKSLHELHDLKRNCKSVILTTVNSIIQKTPPEESLKRQVFSAKKNDIIDRENLIKYLLQTGYINNPIAAETGDFAVRGSIVDIVPVNFSEQNLGIRLDFFGNSLDIISVFDVFTQTCVDNNYDSIKIYPVSEVVINKETTECFLSNYKTLFPNNLSTDFLYNSISEGLRLAGTEHYLPLFYKAMCNITDFLPKNTKISLSSFVLEECFKRIELINECYKSQINFSKDNSFEEIYNYIPPDKLYINSKELKNIFDNHDLIYLSPYRIENSENEKTQIFKRNYSKVPNFLKEAKNNKKSLFEFFKSYLEKHKERKIILTCNSDASVKRITNLLTEYNIVTVLLKDLNNLMKIKSGILIITNLKLEQGFEAEDIIIVSEQDISGKISGNNRSSINRTGAKLLTKNDSFVKGQYVVHSEYGVGKFFALETLTIENNKHDFITILYSGEDKLYIPVENIELLTHYGSENENIKLDKLGLPSWQERKSKIKNRLKIIAEDLIKLAAKRYISKAEVLIPLQKLKYQEFCAKFPHIETEDQLKCIEEVEKDLTSGFPMDRLVCGDVGFGKTEIALRAAFIAVSSGNSTQVAVICPTTLLCKQHYKTFSERFSDTEYIVKDLSRFTKEKERVENREGVKKGTVDIIIGTHSLLHASVKFKNLCLVIIDEEQQFGVSQKEHFKKIRNSIHILSLSATPIPRTFQMSLNGIKDLSIIASPPLDRLSINSYVMPVDKAVLRNAIMREHYRGGKTFFIVPHIKNLNNILEKIKNIVPEIKVALAHGQMPPVKLNNIINSFYDNEYNMLLSTNIIGFGIDLPEANTIIIYDAHMFGLSQLHQLRGRVGRSKLKAYAYFIIPENTILTSVAQKRLEAIQSLDFLGGGLNLAGYDVDIRGCGNLLGKEQSGQIKEVGIELYQKMLTEAIEEHSNNPDNKNTKPGSKKKSAPSVNLDISVYIPSSYIEDTNLRTYFYHRLGNSENNEDLKSIVEEMTDRFGKLPEEVSNLEEIIKIKQHCISLSIEELSCGNDSVMIKFYDNYFEKPDLLINYINENASKLKLRNDHKLLFKGDFKEKKQKIEGIKFILEEISKILK